MKTKYYIIAISILILLAANVLGGSQSSARAVALGGAYTALADGLDAARYNPANLGFKSHQQNGLELFGFGTKINNNAFTISDYNQFRGALLTDNDNDFILSRIPDEGLKVQADLEGSVLGVSFGSFAFYTSFNALLEVDMDRDVIELVLDGYSFSRSIDIAESSSEGVSFITFGAAYGIPLIKFGGNEIAIGATAKYLKGLGIERVTKLEGLASLSLLTGLNGGGELIAQKSEGGTGYAFDIGASIKIQDAYVVGLRVENLYSRFNWDNNSEEYSYSFDFDTLTYSTNPDDYIVATEIITPLNSFTSDLPSVLNLGIAKISGALVWGLDWEQGFSSKIGASTKPRISGGAEYYVAGIIPLRAGVSTGGNRSTNYSAGSGVHLAAFYLDLAFVTGEKFEGGSAKGLNFAITSGIKF